MATFTYAPDWGASPELEPRVRSVQFGDGYEQRATNGLNPILPTWKLQFTKRTQAEAQAIYSWMVANNAQVTAFDWAAPGEGVAAGELSGTGDGTRVTYSLVALSRPCTVVGTPAIYRTDWQGTQLLYSTARTNLWVQSTSLTTAPNAVSTMVVAPIVTTAPDGTTAGVFSVTPDVSNSFHALYQSITHTAAPWSLAVYVKPNGYNYCYLGISGGSTIGVNLLTGATFGALGSTTATVTVRSDGWVKIVVTGNGTASAELPSIRPYPTQTALASFAGDAVSGVLVWHPMNCLASELGAYIPTTSAAVTVTDYTINSAGLVTLAASLATGSTLTWTGSYTRKHVAKFGVPKPDGFNSWSITADFREVPA